MRSLTILYDASCGLCSAARRWLERQELYLPVDFVPCGTPRAEMHFPTLDHDLSRQEVTVVADDGAIWRGTEAWILCLWATHRFRGLSQTLAQPGQMHRARAFFEMVSRQRGRVGSALRLRADAPASRARRRAGSP